MKILTTHRPGGAYGFISDGWINALRDMGHTVERWDGSPQAWHGMKPDLYIGCSGHKQEIPANHTAKITIHVNPLSNTHIKGIDESPETVEWVLKQKPDVVFGYGQPIDSGFWGHWTTKYNIPWVPMFNAGDKTLFNKIKNYKQRQYDIIYLGGRWAYKGITIDKYLMPVLKIPNIKYKLHGWGDWPAGVCSGILDDTSACQFLNNGRIGLCISEQHTQIYGFDIPERAFKLALCGTLVIHDHVPNFPIKSAVVAQSPNDYYDKCNYYINHPDEAEALGELQRQEVLSNHTYHHRMTKLLKSLQITR